MHESRRYLGLELSGAKNQKTSLAALEYYPKEQKIFLLDIFEKVTGHGQAGENDGESSDEALLNLVEELQPGVARLGVNVPLQLPPCLIHTKKTCPAPGKCRSPEVKWMRAATQKAARQKNFKVLEYTPYTQRPVELWVRYQVLPKLPATHRFEIDETLGGNKAPLTARMTFLKRFLEPIPLVEVWPKLTVAILAMELGLSRRVVASYRRLEEGVHAREEILDRLAEEHGVFIYERDIRKLSQSLPAFDAFICAYTALLSDTQECARPPAGFPAASGWVQYPIVAES